jgi:predicted nucleic acid-binding protein
VSGFSFDANILIDALAAYEPARQEIRRATEGGARAWISRLVWIEVLSKGSGEALRRAQVLLSGFSVDEIDAEISARAASLRRDRPRLKAPDAIILGTALLRGRVLVTRNVRDFPANMPGIRVPYTL